MVESMKTELEEAQKALSSIIRKCERAYEKLSQKQPQPASQLTLLRKRLNALRLSVTLIERELENRNKVADSTSLHG